MGQVALLELHQDLQGALLVELLQGLDGPLIQIAVGNQA